MRQYQVGEVVMAQVRGWLRAYRVIRVEAAGEGVEYTLEPLQREWAAPQWAPTP